MSDQGTPIDPLAAFVQRFVMAAVNQEPEFKMTDEEWRVLRPLCDQEPLGYDDADDN